MALLMMTGRAVTVVVRGASRPRLGRGELTEFRRAPLLLPRSTSLPLPSNVLLPTSPMPDLTPKILAEIFGLHPGMDVGPSRLLSVAELDSHTEMVRLLSLAARTVSLPR